MTRSRGTYPLPPPPSGDDARFTVGLLLDTADLLTAALGYAARGWRVFPLVPGHKRPAVTDWEGRATTEAHRIRRCWAAGDYGVGIACGPSGLVVLDLDTPKPDSPPLPADLQAEGATEGLDVLAIVADRAGQPFPAGTYAVRTGRGGTHLYYTHPRGGPELRNTQGTQGGLGPLIDSRAHGGYVVAPPTTVNGNPYTLLAEVPVAPLPGWLTDALTPAPLPPQEPVSVDLSPDRRGAYLRSALAAEAARVAASPAGGRNTALYRAAVALGQLVAGGDLTAEQVTAALAHAAHQLGKDPRETARTIASGLRAGARRPRSVAA